MKEILYILLDNYAEHEIGFMPGAVSTDATGFRKEPKYINKIVAPTMEPVKSLGGMRTLPDYSFETMPADYAALVLIGGFGWMNPEAECVLPIVKDALSKGVVVGAICNAASWMAKQGLLNNMRIILYPRSDFEQMVSYKFQYPMGFNGSVELAFDVPSYADVDKEYQHALYHGAIPVLPPTTEPWGQRTCYVADPDGNLIEIGSFTK